jgi:peptidoglycan/xylan/chitin deacetylase (PgdA/CDA1 family)
MFFRIAVHMFSTATFRVFSKISIKRAIKWSAGCAAAAINTFVLPKASCSACILTYHRVADLPFLDRDLDDWNVPPARLEQQIAAIREVSEIVPLADIPTQLATRLRPLTCLSFDDGYENFATNVLPILERFRVPATIFVVTKMIGLREPMPFDRWSRKNAGRLPPEASRPINWQELEACIASGLVTVGSHSHEHLNARNLSPAEYREEAERSRCELISRLGPNHGNIYAFPYGSLRLGHVPEDYVTAVKQAGYEMAVTTTPGVVHPDSDLFRLPRVEAHELDSPATIQAKVFGTLLPYRITEKLRLVEHNGFKHRIPEHYGQ